MLCTRLVDILPKLVGGNQTAFIKERSIIHNILMCHDLLRHYNRKTTPRCLMKIPLRKAYDMVQWDFVKEMFEGYVFPEKFVQLVMACVTSPRFSVRVNGEGYGYSEGKRGLRQGDPIPPLLFVLVM